MAPEMITTRQLYDGVKALLRKAGKPDTAYGVAKFLEVSATTAGNWEHDKYTMDEPYAIKAARSLKLDPDYVLACLAAERAARAEKPDAAAAWHRIAVRLSTAASVVFLLVFLISHVKSPVI